MTKVIRLEPHSMAVFWKVDVDPGFAMSLCSDVSLFDAVSLAMFMPPLDPGNRAEVQDIVDQLREGGDVNFEDAWISLRTGMAAVTAFLMAKTIEAKEEERWADRQRFEELKRREEAETRHALLRQALVEALGDKGPELAKAAAA